MSSASPNPCRSAVMVGVAVAVAACALVLVQTFEPMPWPVTVILALGLLGAEAAAITKARAAANAQSQSQEKNIADAREQTGQLAELNRRLAEQSREIARQAQQLAQQRDGYKALARDLAEKQSWLDSVVTQLPAGVLLIDKDLNVVSRNDRFRDLLGMPADAPVPKSLNEFHGWPAETPEGRPIIFQDWPLVKAIRDGVVVHDNEMRVGVKGGGWFHAAVSASPIRGPGGDVRGAVLLINDLTVRRESEERLQLLESAVVHANDAIIVLEAVSGSGRGRSVRYVNEAFTQLTGYQREEVLGRSLHFLRGINSDDDTLKDLRVALDQAKPFRTELLNYRKDGSVVWVDLSLVPVQGPDGRCTHYIMIQRDITDRKIAEGSLRESEQLFRGIYESTSAGVSITDEQNRIVSCNPAFCELVGREMNDILGRTPQDLTHPDDWAGQQAFIQDVQAGRRARYQYPKRYLKPDGSVVWTELTFAAIFDSDGNYQYGLGVSVDVSARRTLEEQLRHAQKMEALGQLAGGVAHDFNNLLTAVLGNLALFNLPESDPNRELLTTVETAASRAADLTRKLLGYARRNQILLAPVNPSALFEEVAAILRRTLDPRIEMTVRSGTDSFVIADATLVHQAIMNLCLNARDAMPDGGTLALESELIEVNPETAGHPDAKPGAFVKLSVRDTGHGIPDDIRRRLFEPFFTTKGVGKGTGLGLPMVHGIMQQHDGWVAVDSTHGRGSTFSLFLPAIPTPKQRKAQPRIITPPSVDTPAPRTAATVLLVDDEDMIRNLGRNVLESGGYTVLTASDGAAAIETFSHEYHRIQLVVLDLTMPRLSGKDTYQRLKLIDPNVNVLFSSGYSAEDVSDLDSSIGMLNKPYRPNDLIQAVRKALRKTRELVPA